MHTLQVPRGPGATAWELHRLAQRAYPLAIKKRHETATDAELAELEQIAAEYMRLSRPGPA